MNGYYSATIVGDVDNAITCGLYSCAGSMFCTANLMGAQKKLGNFLHQMVKHKRICHLRSAMSYFDAFAALIGSEDSCGIDARIKMKTNKELHRIAEQTQNSHLMHQVALNQMHVHFYFREFMPCANLAEKYQISKAAKRTFDFYLAFYLGISALNFARDTKQEKWTMIGKDALKMMTGLVKYSTWNFENKQKLLQAELHYLNGRHKMAKLAYQSSIVSAHDHKFVHEEAVACELYGVYLVENKEVEKGVRQLQLAQRKFKQWGALKKAKAVENFIGLVSTTCQYAGVW